MLKDRFRSALGLILALATLSGLSGCGDNPVGDDHDEHVEGMALIGSQGQTVVTITEGPTVTGEIAVAVDETVTFTAVALDEDGERIPLDGEELEVRVGSASEIASVLVQGPDQVVVTGVMAGSGTVLVELYHEDHPERAGPVPVVVQ